MNQTCVHHPLLPPSCAVALLSAATSVGPVSNTDNLDYPDVEVRRLDFREPFLRDGVVSRLQRFREIKSGITQAQVLAVLGQALKRQSGALGTEWMGLPLQVPDAPVDQLSCMPIQGRVGRQPGRAPRGAAANAWTCCRAERRRQPHQPVAHVSRFHACAVPSRPLCTAAPPTSRRADATGRALPRGDRRRHAEKRRLRCGQPARRRGGGREGVCTAKKWGHSRQ